MFRIVEYKPDCSLKQRHCGLHLCILQTNHVVSAMYLMYLCIPKSVYFDVLIAGLLRVPDMYSGVLSGLAKHLIVTYLGISTY